MTPYQAIQIAVEAITSHNPDISEARAGFIAEGIAKGEIPVRLYTHDMPFRFFASAGSSPVISTAVLQKFQQWCNVMDVTIPADVFVKFERLYKAYAIAEAQSDVWLSGLGAGWVRSIWMNPDESMVWDITRSMEGNGPVIQVTQNPKVSKYPRVCLMDGNYSVAEIETSGRVIDAVNTICRELTDLAILEEEDAKKVQDWALNVRAGLTIAQEKKCDDKG